MRYSAIVAVTRAHSGLLMSPMYRNVDALRRVAGCTPMKTVGVALAEQIVARLSQQPHDVRSRHRCGLLQNKLSASANSALAHTGCDVGTAPSAAVVSTEISRICEFRRANSARRGRYYPRSECVWRRRRASRYARRTTMPRPFMAQWTILSAPRIMTQYKLMVPTTMHSAEVVHVTRIVIRIVA